MIRLLDEENRRKAEKEMQEDKRRIEESEYWKYYKKWIPGIEGGEYWNEKNVEGGRKETWARVRTGNVSKEGKKGFIRCYVGYAMKMMKP